MRLDRATARRIAEALKRAGAISLEFVADHGIDGVIVEIVRASAPAKPPGRTKRGKGKQ